MLGQQVESGVESDERGRLRRAGLAAVFAVPAVLSLVTLFVGQWQVYGAAVFLPALLIAVVGAAAAAYAGTAPLALGAMAGLVVAIGSLFRPGGVFGAALAIGAGMLGGAVGGASHEDRAPKPWASGVLGPIAVFGGVAAFILLAALTGAAADPEPAARPQLSVQPFPTAADPCHAKDLFGGPSGAVDLDIEHAGDLFFETSFAAKGGHFRTADRSGAWYTGYVVVTPAGSTEPAYAMATDSGRPIGGKSSMKRSFDGRACSGASEVIGTRFSASAPSGRYEAVAIIVVGQESWRSKPVAFDHVAKPAPPS